MKAPAEVLAQVTRHLEKNWSENLDGPGAGWPHAFPLGKPTMVEMGDRFQSVMDWARQWNAWQSERGVTLLRQTRTSGRSRHEVPSHLPVPDVDAAAALVGGVWPGRLATGRTRLRVLREAFPAHPDLPYVVRAAKEFTDVDFELLVTAAAWFSANPDCRLSPRQVPIEGLHSKWLNAKGRTELVRHLAQVQDLGLLVDARPVPVEFTYLDPVHLAGGGRVHDSVAPGTPMVPAYEPEVVIISENKDTAVLFPQVAGAVAVQGHGAKGPSRIARVPWLAGARVVVYWGDLDGPGFEIVHRYRAAGVPVETILMDPETLTRYARFGATTDAEGRPLVRPAPKRLGHLSEVEQQTYRMLTEPGSTHPIRVEQERIPLAVAAEEVERVRSAQRQSR